MDRASDTSAGRTVEIARPSAGGLRTRDYDYPFDERLVAQRPARWRDASRLLVVRRADRTLEDLTFDRLPELIPPGDLIVVNDSRVFPARLLGYKPTGAAAEILLIRPLADDADRWQAIVRPGGKLKPGRRVRVAHDLEVVIEESTADGGRIVRLLTDLPIFEALTRFGHVPLPPYIRRDDDAEDRVRYQTVYARETGSVAAPTAGLHITEHLLGELDRRGVEVVAVTLHVGPGTFRPIEEEDPSRHRLDAEWYRVTPAAAEAINSARARGAGIWAVGTTVVRTLETAADESGAVRAGEGRTELYVLPGFDFRATDHLITNFHLPRSTLLMLVAAFAGHELTMSAYRHAVAEGYRFYSYGDASLIL